MNPEQFTTELQKKGIELSDRQLEQFAIYFQTLVEWNEKINLTALTSEADVYLKHFYDSISAAFYYDFNEVVHICDVVTVAGFHSITLTICFQHLHISNDDSLSNIHLLINPFNVKLDVDIELVNTSC